MLTDWTDEITEADIAAWGLCPPCAGKGVLALGQPCQDCGGCGALHDGCTFAGGEIAHPGSTEKLMEYWAHGKGALKIKWGVHGDFLRCVRHLRKYFPRNPKGLCNHLHQRALGVAPGQEGKNHHSATVGEMAMDDCTAEFCANPVEHCPDCSTGQFCRNPLHKGPCKGFKRGGGIAKIPGVDMPDSHGIRRHGHEPNQHRGVTPPAKPKAVSKPKKAAAKGGFPRVEHGPDTERRVRALDAMIYKMHRDLGPIGKWSEADRKQLDKLQRLRRHLLGWAARGEHAMDATEGFAAEDIEVNCPKGKRMGDNGDCVPDDDADDSSYAAELAAIDDMDPEVLASLPKVKTWQGTIVPIGKLTGDGRRIGVNALEVLDQPVALLWQRETSQGHAGSVVVGVSRQIDVNDKRGFGRGVWFDTPEADQARALTDAKAIGPSIDLDNFQFEARVRDTEDKFDPATHCTGQDCPQQEAYVSSGRIRAVTLVPIAAFAEVYDDWQNGEEVDEEAVHAALAALDPSEFAAADEEDCGCDQKVAKLVKGAKTLTAATTVIERPPAAVFARREMDRPVAFRSEGEAIFGYVAKEGTCHIDFKASCVTVPHEPDYSLFTRYPILTQDGHVMAGRFTVGYGRFVGQCGCCNSDDHACTRYDLAAAIAHYDQMDTVAHVNVGFDDHGLWYAGTWAAGATDQAKQVVSRRGVSGDWRRAGDSLRLVEVMGVSTTTPAFPVGSFTGEVVMSLVAAGRIQLLDESRMAWDQDLDAAVGRLVERKLTSTRRGGELLSQLDDIGQTAVYTRAARRDALMAQLGN